MFAAASGPAPTEPAPAPAAAEATPPAPGPAAVQPAETAPPVTPTPEAPAEPTVINEAGHRVPLSEHLAEREKRQAAERRAEEAERRAQDFERQFRQAQQPQRQPVPDALENPQAYAEHLQSEMDRRMRGMVVNMSFDMVRESNPTGFQAAWAALQDQVRSGNTRLRDEIVGSANPGSALMRWHQREETLRQIGEGGLDGYRTRTLEEALKDPSFRTRAMEVWRAEAGQMQTGTSPPPPSIPSLNQTTGAARKPDGVAMSGAELFEAASAPRRR